MILLRAFYFGLLITNGLIALACLIAVPNVWVRRMGVTFLWANGIILMLAASFFSDFAFENRFNDDLVVGLAYFAAVSAPVAIEFLVLLSIYFFKLRKWTFPPNRQN